ncbi:hypothetical protein DSL92_03280 [Billgrantia gudaonensis]|uniref:Uncharacterized protein n=1 Tax=Billgrantia gudaonensis TaxID=376427 RepID=A0A432JL05_9GAMM|nr:hypothetical protein DSL92_03280 [Halomonas gudaonensis]
MAATRLAASRRGGEQIGSGSAAEPVLRLRDGRIVTKLTGIPRDDPGLDDRYCDEDDAERTSHPAASTNGVTAPLPARNQRSLLRHRRTGGPRRSGELVSDDEHYASPSKRRRHRHKRLRTKLLDHNTGVAGWTAGWPGVNPADARATSREQLPS